MCDKFVSVWTVVVEQNTPEISVANLCRIDFYLIFTSSSSKLPGMAGNPMWHIQIGPWKAKMVYLGHVFLLCTCILWVSHYYLLNSGILGVPTLMDER